MPDRRSDGPTAPIAGSVALLAVAATCAGSIAMQEARCGITTWNVLFVSLSLAFVALFVRLLKTTASTSLARSDPKGWSGD